MTKKRDDGPLFFDGANPRGRNYMRRVPGTDPRPAGMSRPLVPAHVEPIEFDEDEDEDPFAIDWS